MSSKFQTRADASAQALGAGSRLSSLSWLIWPALLVVVVAVAFGIESNYWLQVAVNAEIMVIAVIGLYVTFGLNGQVSLGHAGFYAIGAYTAGLLVSSISLEFLWAMILGTIAAGFVGLLLGIPALRLKGHYLALATIGFGQVVALILTNWAWLTGGANGVRNITSPLIAGIELKTVPEWAVFIGIIAVIAVFVVDRIRVSSFGRAMRAIRDSDVAASAMGVSLPRTKVLAFTIGAAFAGLAGSLNAGFVTYISPGTYDLSLSVAMLAMIVVGGASSPWGAVIGAVLLTVLPELLRPVQEYYLLAYGLLLLFMVAFVPGGIIKLVPDLVRKAAGLFTRRSRRADASEGEERA